MAETPFPRPPRPFAATRLIIPFKHLGLNSRKEWFEAIAQMIIDGSASAQDEFKDALRKGLYFLVIRKVPIEQADALIQEVFVSILASIRNEGVIRADVLFELIRTELQKRIELFADRIPVPKFTPRMVEMIEEETVIIKARLIGLKANDLEVLDRFYNQGQTIETICEDMGITIEKFRSIKAKLKPRKNGRA